MPRHLSSDFLSDFSKKGLLSPFAERVISDKSLCLELRGTSINVYYRGGSLLRLKVVPGEPAYTASFDTNYFPQKTAAYLPVARVCDSHDVDAWLKALPEMKQAMDLKESAEREMQQLLVRDNNFGSIARSTDYYICDIEYANHDGRFDFVAVRWPSTPADRKRRDGHRLVLGEVKYGDGALDGSAGLDKHVNSINNFLATPDNLKNLKDDMVKVFNQKRALGLIDCGRDLDSFSHEPPILMLVLANHDPDKSRLRDILRALPPSPHAELRVASACLFGYGLYDPAILTPAEAITRFGSCI